MLCVPATILHAMVCILLHVWTVWLGTKMAAIHKRFEISRRALQVIILLSEMKAAVKTYVCME